MTITRLALVLGCIASVAGATDYPQEARKLSLKERNGRQSLSWAVSLPPPVLPSQTPVTVGAILQVRTQGGETATFGLPAYGWTADASGQTFKYRNPSAPGPPSPIKSVTLKNQRAIRATGKGIGITLDEMTQGAVAISLVVGADAYCSLCTAPRRDEPGSYVALRCPAPAECAFVCGNGVVDSPSEECDGEAGVCGPSSYAVCSLPSGPPSYAGCECCGIHECGANYMTNDYFSCCAPNACQLTHMASPFSSSALAGVCIPPTCSDSADCNGYECVGGTCCGHPGAPCGTVDCCAGTGSSCIWPDEPVVPSQICCLPTGSPCNEYWPDAFCCSQHCTSGGVCY